MPVVSQSIIRPIVPVGASTDAWLLRTPNSSPPATASSHEAWAAEQQVGGHQLLVDARRRVAVQAQHAEHVRLVLGEAGERAHAGRDAGRGGVGVAGHQRGDATADSARPSSLS